MRLRTICARGFARAGGPLLLLGILCLAGVARGDGVGLVTTAKSLPPATIAVIDPESGTSSGGGTTDVRIGVGDIILFRFSLFPVPNAQIHGLNGWLTEYVPPNTEVVGVRILDSAGQTVPPNYPGIATDGCARPCNGFNSVPSMGGTANLDDGSLAQVYADTGVFYSTDARTGRNPNTSFIQLDNGILMTAPRWVTDIDGVLGTSAPYYAHNLWDDIQVRAFGTSTSASGNSGTGNTPFDYGSPVAGPLSHYGFEATEVAPGTVEFNDVVGPWQRVRYEGSLIGNGAAVTGGGPLARMVTDASTLGFDLTPLNPLPAGTNALRVALGEVRVGEPMEVEVALRVLGTPIDNVQMQDVNCGESMGGDTSARSTTTRGNDNMWSLYLGSPACVYLNLQFDLDSDRPLAVGGEVIEFTSTTRNLSTSTQTNVWVRQKYDSSRVSLEVMPYPDIAPTCVVSNCDGDGLECLLWNIGTMAPSAQVDIRTRFGVGGGGQVSHVMRADYTSTALGTITGDPCAGGSVTDPGFRAQEINMIRGVGVITGDLASTTPTAAPGGTTSFSGNIGVTGTSSVSFDETIVVLPSGWTVTDSNSNGTPDVTYGGVVIECTIDCATNMPGFNLAVSLASGVSNTITFDANVPGVAASGLYAVGMQVWASQTGFGGRYETYFPAAATVAVGAPRSDPPVLSCPVLSSWTSIPGTTTEADGTTIRIFFNGVERAVGSATGGTFDVGGFLATFGALYGGLEVRATATAPGELESEPSAPCDVTAVSQCQDGLDNDGDMLIDFPADPGCSSPTDSDETDPACSDGMDNDGDGDTDWPADLECDGPDDDSEGGSPACSDGVDNDGDGLTDFPADPDCTSATDRTEMVLRRCMNGIDDDGDGLIDFPADPGCHSSNDDNEADFSYLASDVRARLLFVFDTSGSMNWHTCADEFTDGDGSGACAGSDVTCATCPTTPGCGNGIADDSRIFQARQGISNVVAGFGEVEYGLMRFHQRPHEFSCPTTNASEGSGGWQGAGASPCGGGFSGGDLLVGFSPENEYDLLEWMDNDTNNGVAPPPALDFELRGSGTTPIAGSLGDARTYLDGVRAGDSASSCRPYRVILITDGAETCGGTPTTAAAALNAAGYPTYVIGFATPDPTVRATLDSIASSGGTTAAIFADDSTALSAAVNSIVTDSILVELCNGGDDDCDGLVDEGFSLYCNVPGGVTTATLCTDPGETVCNGTDDNCDGVVDEGLLNACGLCGPTPIEICNGLDDDCDGPIDEGCPGICVIEPEICDGSDNDCDGLTDESLSRPCGTSVGVCTVGVELCSVGTWGACSGVTPGAGEICNGLDDDCDGVIDGITRACGSGVGSCSPGTETCTVGAWSGMCIGAIGPAAEVCNSADDDCNGLVDDGDPGGGGPCGSAIGACTAGAFACSGGGLVCVGGTGPTMETCDGVDQDCNGTVDDGVPTGAACGSCGDGVLTCVGGAFVCRGDRAPGTEICNSIDDDCDGLTDEGDPGGGAACGSDTGECTAGTRRCVMGMLICDGEVGPGTESCNGLDDDCNGLVDDGNPGGGAACGATDVGECDFGALTCSGGALVCIGDTGPSAERCDGLDNDCDGMTDEGDPGGGMACGDDTGECSMGTFRCTAGGLVCDGAVGPTPEVCDALDNDCDGVVDDGLDVGAPCGSDVGECVPGLLSCVGGAVICDGEIGPVAESCNALDDDCDAIVDEELPLGGECGMTAGACVPGMLSCVDGFEVCVGEVPSGPEVCDCDDNDCDGMVDEEPPALCPGASRCIDCSCALPCMEGEFGRCPDGRVPVEDATGCFCVAPRCNPETCGSETVEVDGEVRCGPDMVGVPECSCRSNACTFPCDGVVCDSPTVCHPIDGTCVEDNCRGLGCAVGEICDITTLGCIPDPCADAACAMDQACRMGVCEESCATMTCGAGEICRGGVCEMDLCVDAGCDSGQVCVAGDGSCVDDLCPGVECTAGSVCDPATGMCTGDPCTFVRCPDGQLCTDGECVLDAPITPDAGMPPADAGMTGSDAGIDGGGDLEERVLATGGCACEAAGGRQSPGAPLLLLSLLGLFIWRRRRG